MEFSIAPSRRILLGTFIVACTWLIVVAIGWAIAANNWILFAGLPAGIVLSILFLRWPSFVFTVLYPLTWVFWSYNLPGIGRPERIIGVLGIAGLIILALGPGRALFPSIPGVMITGLFFLIGAYTVSALIHHDLPNALDYVVSLLTRVTFLYLAYFHLQTTKRLRWAVTLFIAVGGVAAFSTLGVSLVYGFGFNRDPSALSAMAQSLGPLVLTMVGSANLGTASALLLVSLYPMASQRAHKTAIILLTLFLLAMAFAAEFRREVLITVPLLLAPLILDKTAGLRRPALWLLGLSILLFLGVALPYSLVLRDRLDYETQFVVAGTEPRIASAFAGLQAAANSPLTGYGPGAYAQAIYPILGPGRRGYEYSPYNVFVWILVEAGIFGLVGVVLILIGTYREASKAKGGAVGVEGLVLRSAPALLLLIVIWFMFGNAWELSLPWFLMGIILAAARIADEHRLSEAVSTG